MRTRCATLWTMPRVTGESLCSTTWCSFLKPRAITVARWRSVPPIGLLTSSSLRVRVFDSAIGGGLSYGWFSRWCFGRDWFDWGRGGGGRSYFDRSDFGRRRARCRSWRRRGGCDAAAHLDHGLRVAQIGQRQQRRLDDVDRVRAAERLRQNVLDPGRFDDGAHGAAGDHPGARRGWLEQDLR